MASPYLGEIRMSGFSFPPVGWELCNGKLLSIAENDALFALLGTTYGGDGVNTFAVPDLRGRMPLGSGTGLGLTTRVVAQAAGTPTETLTTQQMPAHTHNFQASVNPGNRSNGSGNLPAAARAHYASAGDGTTLSPTTVSLAGGNLPHNNMPPYQVINFIICTAGIFPSQG